MTLPLSPIETMALLLATLLGVRLIATRLAASIAEYAMVGVGFALWYLGPLLCGKDWYDISFFLGVLIGIFGQLAHVRRQSLKSN
jgi:hypothetical protein